MGVLSLRPSGVAPLVSLLPSRATDVPPRVLPLDDGDRPLARVPTMTVTPITRPL